MDLIYKNQQHEDVGVLHSFSCDYDVADTMDFRLDVGLKNNVLKGGYYWFIPDTEYGGKIDKLKVVTENEKIEYYGRNIRGLLASKIIIPPKGSDYKTVEGYVTDIVSDLIADTGYMNLFTVEGDTVQVKNFKFARYVSVYDGIRALCRVCNYVPVFTFDVYGVCHITFTAAVDYTDEREYSADDLGFEIEKVYSNVNHLICLGKGDLKDRTVVDLYVQADGSIGQTQYYSGDDEVTEVYDYSSAESKEELVSEGTKQLKELSNADSFSVKVNVTDIPLHVGDIVGGIERTTDTYVSAEITNVIASITEDYIELEYQAGGDRSASGSSASSRASSSSQLQLYDNVQLVTTQVTNVYNTTVELTQVVEVVKDEVDTLKATMITTDTLIADMATIASLETDNAFIENLVANKTFSDELTASQAFISKLDADFANLDTATIEQAKIQDLVAGTGWFEKSVSSESYAFKLVGDVIKANTLALEELVFVDDLGNPTQNLVYTINKLTGGLDTETYTDEQLSEKLNGKDIIANSITADQINVDSIFAQDITATGTITGAKLIGGSLNITIPDDEDFPISVTFGENESYIGSYGFYSKYYSESSGCNYLTNYGASEMSMIASSIDGSFSSHSIKATVDKYTCKLSMFASATNETITIDALEGTITASAFSGNATSATKVNITDYDANAWLYPTFVNGRTTNSKYALDVCESFSIHPGANSTSETPAILQLGNNVASGTSGNKRGYVRLYGAGTYYCQLAAGTLTANSYITFPNATGEIITTGNMAELTACNKGSFGTAATLNFYHQTAVKPIPFDSSIPTTYAIATWNGAYNSNNNSNLKYCASGIIVATSGNYVNYLTSAASYAYLHVGTNAGAYGVNWWASDTKLKKNIVETEETALDKVDAIDFIAFDWKDDDRGHVKLGVSANQIQEIIPEAIMEVEQPEDYEYDIILQIDTGKMTTYALKAIKELYSLVKEQQKEIKKLKELTEVN